MNWYLEVLKKYAVFSGRARRKEYWMFFLFNFIIASMLWVVGGLVGSQIIGTLYDLAVFIPSIAVFVRRLHDTGRSGWWCFIALIPLIGWIVLLFYMVEDGNPGQNQYGANPKEETTEKNKIESGEMKKCLECAELVRKEARICRFCGYEFYPKPVTQEQEIEEFTHKQALRLNQKKNINIDEDEEI